jgi:hypothetical protein
MRASTDALKDSKSKEVAVCPRAGIEFIDRENFRIVDLYFRLRRTTWAVLLVLLLGFHNGGAHNLCGLNFDAETDNLMFTNEDVISVGHGSIPLK